VKVRWVDIASLDGAASALHFGSKAALTVAAIPAHYSIGLKLPLPPIV
jgi:hypothetical protein